MDWWGLAAAVLFVLLGVLLVVLRKTVARALRLRIQYPAEIRGWGYWERLVPNEEVATRLGEMAGLIAGLLVIAVGLWGVVVTLLGRS